jgi:hypothetical protein
MINMATTGIADDRSKDLQKQQIKTITYCFWTVTKHFMGIIISYGT